MRARHRTARDAFAAEHARRLAAALLEPAHERLMRMKAAHAGGVADRILRFDQISMREFEKDVFEQVAIAAADVVQPALQTAGTHAEPRVDGPHTPTAAG